MVLSAITNAEVAGKPVDEWGIRVGDDKCTPVGASVSIALRNLMQARRRTALLATAIGLVTVLLVCGERALEERDRLRPPPPRRERAARE